MPGRDGTGPLGNGVVFGRRLGYCNVVSPKTIGCGLGMGLGLGLGMGFRGRRNVGAIQRGLAAFDVEAKGSSDKQILEEQKRLLEDRLNLINTELENHKE